MQPEFDQKAISNYQRVSSNQVSLPLPQGKLYRFADTASVAFDQAKPITRRDLPDIALSCIPPTDCAAMDESHDVYRRYTGAENSLGTIYRAHTHHYVWGLARPSDAYTIRSKEI